MIEEMERELVNKPKEEPAKKRSEEESESSDSEKNKK